MFTLDTSHINTEDFRREALKFLENKRKHGEGFYIDRKLKGTKEWNDYWNLQEHYCKNGYSIGGVKITGPHYFYLNFCQISLKLAKKITNLSELSTKRVRVATAETFPDFWDSDWFYFNECKRAEDLGLHMIVLKPRRRGYSFKNASLCAYDYTFSKVKSNSLILAEDKKYSMETLQMSVNYLDFLIKYTRWGRTRTHINRPSEMVQASFEEITPDGRKLIGGTMSRIMQYSTLNNAEVARGKDARRILFEEAGSMSNLKSVFSVTRHTVESEDVVSGQMIVFGCVCAGTKVWTNKGYLVNIEDLKQEDGILGYDNHGVNKEPITWIQPPAKKPCYRITTIQGTVLECSEDHPIFWSYNGYSYNERINVNGKRISIKNTKKGEFKETKNIKTGDQIAVINSVPIFGEKVMWNPRLVGMLIGDGSYGFDKTPRLFNCDVEVNNYIDSNFNTKVEKQYITKDDRLYRETRIKNICPQLRELGIYGQTKLEKRLPINIYDYNKFSLCELIAGLYDTDGYIGKNRLVLTSSSDVLLEQVKNILIKIGVHSYITKIDVSKYGKTNKKIKDVNDYYRLMITDFTSIVNFYKNVKLLIKYKQNALNNIIKYNMKGKEDVEIIYVKRKEENKNYINKTDLYGIRFESVKTVEYIGEKEIYNLTAGDTHTYIANNIITHNTGGDFSGGMVDFEEMFYDPETYNFLAYDNTYDEGSTTQIGYFLPDNYSKLQYITDQGISLHKEAKEATLIKREHLRRTSKDINKVDRDIAENPLKPSEAMLKMGTNHYPKAEINRQIARIKGDKALSTLGITGFMSQDETGKVMFNPSTDFKPILNFPYKPDVDGEGCIIQYQPPFKMENHIPRDLYYIATDPYAIDKDKEKKITSRDSLGAAYVIKRINNFSKPFDIIVAEYVARPKFQDDFNRQLFLLAEYYNAKIVFENDRDGNIMSYARTNKLLHRLEEELTVYDNNDTPRRKLGRNYGVSMSNIEVKKQAVQYFKDWLLSPREKNENGEFELNLHKIYSIPLLEEILKFSYDGNFDRHSAMLVAMLYKKELLLKPQLELREKSVYDDPFFVDLKQKFGFGQTL